MSAIFGNNASPTSSGFPYKDEEIKFFSNIKTRVEACVLAHMKKAESGIEGEDFTWAPVVQWCSKSQAQEWQVRIVVSTKVDLDPEAREEVLVFEGLLHSDPHVEVSDCFVDMELIGRKTRFGCIPTTVVCRGFTEASSWVEGIGNAVCEGTRSATERAGGPILYSSTP